MIFCATVRNTVKTLFRSFSVWLVLTLFSYTMIRSGLTPHVIYVFGDPLPFTLRNFAEEVSGAVDGGLYHMLPFLTVVSTVLIVNRDLGDSLFEIEKAANVSPLRYFLGRMCGVAMISFTAQWILGFIELQFAVYNRGGLVGYTFLRYLGLSVYRLTYVNLCTALPTILFYMSMTYLIGMLFKNGIAAAVGGFSYMMVSYYGWRYLRRRLEYEIYVGYLNPLAEKVRYYFTYQGLEDEQAWFAAHGTSLPKALIALGILVIACVCCSVFSYLLVRKREV